MSQKYPTPTKEELIARMDDGLDHFLTFIAQFSEEQLLEPTDAVGWNGRDHITHLAAWAEGIAAHLHREDRWAAMGLSLDNPQGDNLDYDTMNEEIAEQHRQMPPAEAQAWLVAAHKRAVAAVEPLTEDDLTLPYDRYVVPFTGDGGRPVWNYVAGNTFGHYQQHTPWIAALVERSSVK